jgi:hypothetical protein
LYEQSYRYYQTQSKFYLTIGDEMFKSIIYSSILSAAILFGGCNDGNDDSNGNSLKEASTGDRNQTTDQNEQNSSNSGQMFEFTTLRPIDQNESKSGRVTYDEAKKRCENFKNHKFPDGGFRLPTIAELESIDTPKLKEIEEFNFIKTLDSNSYTEALIIWAEGRKGFVLYRDPSKKDIEYKEPIGENDTEFYICIKPLD